MGDEELNRWIKEGAAEERAAIVELLKRLAADDAERVDGDTTLFRAIAAIERGDHLSRRGEDNGS